MVSLTRFIEDSLRLTVNTRKSAVDRPWKRSFLGFTLSRKGQRLKVADKAVTKLKTQIRILSRRTWGHSLARVIADLKETLLGWKAYFDEAEVLSPLRARPGQVDTAENEKLRVEAMGPKGVS